MKSVSGTASDIAKRMEGGLVEPGGHNILIYDDLAGFRQVYSQYAGMSLPEDEIVLLATQYESIDRVKNNLMDAGINVPRHVKEGTLFVIDAQQGYCGGDVKGTFKLAMTLVSRVKKEKRRGFTWMGDMGSFFGFHKIHDMMDYELSVPQKFEDVMKTVCCYHARDFENLGSQQQEALLDHHYKSILVK